MGPNDDNPARRTPPGRGARDDEPDGRPYNGPGDGYEGRPYSGTGGRAEPPWRPALQRLLSRFRTTPVTPPARHAAPGGGLPIGLAVNPKVRRQRRLMAAFAVFIMVAGVLVIGGTYFVDGVKTSDQLTFPATTTVYYSDGSPVSKLGEETRYELSYDEMNDAVLKTIVASEDQTFWTNDGVDFGSVVRAAWNNFTGGDVQGGSTITQQYARLAFDLQGVTYQRKAREAVLAWKISDKLDKKTILASYLNAVPFGRQTYGIEAAAQAYFGKTAKRTAPPEQQITWAEAMVLVSMVKQPNPDPSDPVGHPGYDPTFSPEAKANSQSRWNYVKD